MTGPRLTHLKPATVPVRYALSRRRFREAVPLDDDRPDARPAADEQRLAGDEAIGAIAEEHHCASDIVAAAKPLHRNGLGQRLLALALRRNDAAEHFGVR